MRLATIRTGGTTRAVRVDGDMLVDLGASDIGELLGHDGWAGRARAAVAASTVTYRAAGADYAPVVPHPSKVVCVGLNYRTHIQEMGRDLPEYPTLFAKFADTPGAEASDMLKYFSERIPATFVYAGIDVERNGLLSGTRGEQIAGRFGMVRTSAFPRGEYWTGLISALEDSLRLHRHQPGALAGLEEYLHRRTGGMIGSLLRLIRGAAIQAVLDGTEKITRSALDSIGVDIASETAGTGRRRPGAPRYDT